MTLQRILIVSGTHGNEINPVWAIKQFNREESSVNHGINYENGQIYLLVGNSCPWCQRTLLVHEIKHLSKKVKVIFLKADIEHGEWIFNKTFKG